MIDLWKEVHMRSPYTDILYQVNEDTMGYVSLHSHAFYEILLIRSGNIQYLLADKRFQVQAGDILLIPPGVSHQPLFTKPLKESYERYVIWINADFWHSLCQDYPDLDFAFRQCEKRGSFLLRSTRATWSPLFSTAAGILKESKEKKLNWMFCGRFSVVLLMAHISRTYYYQDIRIPDTEASNRIDDLIQYIDEHLKEKITLERTARHFLVSQSTISHCFKETMHESFHHCVIQRRLIAAKNGILSGIPLQEIWEQCGFPDYSAFYRSFKKEYGISPREFKQLHSAGTAKLYHGY